MKRIGSLPYLVEIAKKVTKKPVDQLKLRRYVADKTKTKPSQANVGDC